MVTHLTITRWRCAFIARRRAHCKQRVVDGRRRQPQGKQPASAVFTNPFGPGADVEGKDPWGGYRAGFEGTEAITNFIEKKEEEKGDGQS